MLYTYSFRNRAFRATYFRGTQNPSFKIIHYLRFKSYARYLPDALKDHRPLNFPRVSLKNGLIRSVRIHSSGTINNIRVTCRTRSAYLGNLYR